MRLFEREKSCYQKLKSNLKACQHTSNTCYSLVNNLKLIVFDWFGSYLSDKQEYFRYNGACSRKEGMQCCIPQGSILDLLLLLLCDRDISNVSQILDFVSRKVFSCA